jgi:hypothetical protein
MVTRERYKNNNILCLWKNPDDEKERPFSFGYGKAKLIVANLDRIKKCAAEGGDVVLRRDAQDKHPFVFNDERSRLILANLDDIWEFADEDRQESQEEKNTRDYVEGGLGNHG